MSTGQLTSQKGIAAASLAVLLLVILSIMVNTSMFLRCKFGDNCNPFSGVSMKDQAQNADANAKAIGAASQFMLALDVSGNNMLDASKKYVYCREGPGTVGDLRCSNTPQESDITSAAEGYRPYPQDVVNALSEELPFLRGFTHSFTLSRGGTTVLTASDQGGAQLRSRFIFAAPIAGGENIRMQLEMSKGQTATGVVKK